MAQNIFSYNGPIPKKFGFAFFPKCDHKGLSQDAKGIPTRNQISLKTEFFRPSFTNMYTSGETLC